MAPIDLSGNERKVLISLMKNPGHTDTELAGALALNLYTFNKIKNSLLHSGKFRKRYVPNYGKLGFEMMVVTYGKNIDSFLAPVVRDRLWEKISSQVPTRFFFKLLEIHQGLGFHALENFTGMKRGLLMNRRLLEQLNLEVGKMNHVRFSFRDLRVWRFFDMLPLLEFLLCQDISIPLMQPHSPEERAGATDWEKFFRSREEGSGLNDSEEKVLRIMVASPNEGYGHYLQNTGLSRYKVKKIKDKLFKEGYIKPAFTPDLFEFGMEVVIFTHLKIKPNITSMDIADYPGMQAMIPPNLFFLGYDAMEAVAMGIYSDFSKGSAAHSDFQDRLKNIDLVEGEPHLQIISLLNCSEKEPLTLVKPLEHKNTWSLPKLPSDRSGSGRGRPEQMP